MIQRCNYLRFPLESSPKLGVIGELAGQKFYGHFSLNKRVSDQVNDRHTPSTKLALDLITADFLWNVRLLRRNNRPLLMGN